MFSSVQLVNVIVDLLGSVSRWVEVVCGIVYGFVGVLGWYRRCVQFSSVHLVDVLGCDSGFVGFG